MNIKLDELGYEAMPASEVIGLLHNQHLITTCRMNNGSDVSSKTEFLDEFEQAMIK